MVCVAEIDAELEHRARPILGAQAKSNLKIFRADVLDENFRIPESFDRIYGSLSVQSVPEAWSRHLLPNGLIGCFVQEPYQEDLCSFQVIDPSMNVLREKIDALQNEEFSSSGHFGGLAGPEKTVEDFFR